MLDVPFAAAVVQSSVIMSQHSIERLSHNTLPGKAMFVESNNSEHTNQVESPLKRMVGESVRLLSIKRL
jgi:hypothetical protein